METWNTILLSNNPSELPFYADSTIWSPNSRQTVLNQDEDEDEEELEEEDEEFEEDEELDEEFEDEDEDEDEEELDEEE